MNKTLLITGGTGYIGSNLLNKAALAGYDIIGIYNKKYPTEFSENIKWIKYDGTLDSLLMIQDSVDLILHLATYFTQNHSYETLDKLLDSNITFGVHLLEFAKLRNVKNFINTSTYAQSIDGSDFNPQNLYCATKQAFENILEYYIGEFSIKCITLSLYDTYGPKDNRPKFINLLLSAINKTETFNMSLGNQKMAYVYIDDVIEAYLTSMNLLFNNKISRSQTYSIYGDEILTLNELVILVNKATNANIVTNPGFYSYRNREIMDFNPKYERLPNWCPKYNLLKGINKILSHEY